MKTKLTYSPSAMLNLIFMIYGIIFTAASSAVVQIVLIYSKYLEKKKILNYTFLAFFFLKF